MSCVTDVPLNQFESSNPLVQDTKKVMLNNEAETKCDVDETEASIVEIFPWIPEFQQMCKCILADQTMASLTHLMQCYMRNVSVSVNECSTKPLRASKLKDSMNETLLLFLYVYRTISENHDKHIYLSTMSDLLAKYIDMELKSSKRTKEDHEKITARLISCLYIYLGHSTEHLLNTIMKIQFMSRNYHDILHPIIKKIMKNVPAPPESNIMYIRYFLVYRLWRKINNDFAVKNEIMTSAISSLGAPPATFSSCALEDVLPKVPKSQSYCTKSLLQQKFDIKKSCELFIEFCRTEKRNTFREEKEANRNMSQTLGDNPACKTSDIVDNKVSKQVVDKNSQNISAISLSSCESNNSVNQANLKPLNNISNNVANSSTNLKSAKFGKSLCRRKSKMSNEILIIDLTSDVVSEKVVKKRRTKRLAWLEEVKKRIDAKTEKAPLKMKMLGQDANDVSLCDNSTNSSHQLEESLHSKLACTAPEMNSASKPARSVLDDKTSDGAKSGDPKASCTQSTDAFNRSMKNIPPATTVSEDNRATSKEAPHLSSSPHRTPAKSQGDLHSSAESVLIPSYPHNSADKPNDGRSSPESRDSTSNKLHTQTVIKRLNGNNVKRSKKVQVVEAVDTKTMSIEAVLDESCCPTSMIINEQVVMDEITKSSASVNVSNTNAHEEILGESGSKENYAHLEERVGVDGSLVDDSVEKKRTEPEKNKDFTNSGICNNSFTFSVMKGDHLGVQAELEISNYSEETDDVVVDGQNKLQTGVSVSVVTISGEQKKEDIGRPVQSVKQTESAGNENFDKETRASLENPENMNFSLPPCSTERTIRSDSRYVIHDSELQGNIDGLSLLASVSQHVPHLKADSEPKCNQIKVKDYASLRDTSLRRADDEETHTTNDSNAETQLCENPTVEVINRIVGIYPEENLDKVALHVEVSSSRDVEPENSVEYNSHVLSNNNVTNENSVQPGKDNTNVILNGETVVLLQKSPNSNLYIINKAVENGREQINEEEPCGTKGWLSISTEDNAGVEVINGNDQANFDLAQYSKEFLYQESKFSVARSKGIKMELEEDEEPKRVVNFADSKVYVKKGSLLPDAASQHAYQEINAVDKRKMNVKAGLSYGQSVKQEYNNILNHIASNCGIQAYQTVHSHQHDAIEAQHSLHVPASLYGNCPGATDLCVPCHKHCSTASCNLQINNTSSLRQHPQPGSSCGRTHCSCLNCAYDIVTHCPQYLHPSTEARMPCIDNQSYFLPSHSSVQTSAVQDYERTSSGSAITKLYDDQLLCKIEQSLLKVNSLEKMEVKRDAEKVNKDNLDSKLPLKKRLKAMMSMTYDEIPAKNAVDSYPGVPMMSIAALEPVNGSKEPQIAKSGFEATRHENEPREKRQVGSETVRRDYYMDVRISSNSHRNVADGAARKHERQFRNDRDNDSTVHQESFHQKAFKTAAQRKQGTVSTPSPLKRLNAESMAQENPSKKAKKSSSASRQTRSSKRNVPKVNYSYTDVDPEWNPSGESKRKRKKTSR